eukprot:maker-scaffold_12-snap-gene-9.5-mRNA-1 protein AED:0.00 eAED:0.00 QI:93/1/1/1/1/1/2/108/161
MQMLSSDINKFTRKSNPDVNGIVNKISYSADQNNGFIRNCSRVLEIRKTYAQQEAIKQRKNLPKFGKAATEGGGRGISEISREEIKILDPKSEEAQKTAADVLIDGIQRLKEAGKAAKQAAQKSPKAKVQKKKLQNKKSSSDSIKSETFEKIENVDLDAIT